jgi:drug/metabolite transporter (DMT)-like permease
MKLSILQILLLIAMAFTLATGQVLFKLAAVQLPSKSPLGSLLIACLNWHMLLALVVYGIATGLWVYLLRDVPLTRAYPFLALAFAVVPFAGWVVFSEPISLRYWMGLGIMLAGLYLVADT